MLTHRERMEKCLAGVKPDRVPLALWRHFLNNLNGAGLPSINNLQHVHIDRRVND